MSWFYSVKQRGSSALEKESPAAERVALARRALGLTAAHGGDRVPLISRVVQQRSSILGCEVGPILMRLEPVFTCKQSYQMLLRFGMQAYVC